MFTEPNYTNAKCLLDKFVDDGLESYSRTRNFDYGPSNRSNVSNLSPYIKKRILHEKQVILSCIKKFDKSKIDKFLQEVFWRIYWKGWLEGRPKVWSDYRIKLNEIHTNLNNKNYFRDYLKATSGQTGIECFDQWVHELIEYGYLHNHTRMWFASIWIFTLNLPWELGAHFFYKNLLDADAASNTLSWRWVAGLHTQGKFYLARQDNIEKFSNFSFNQLQLKEKIHPPSFEFYEYKNPNFLDNCHDNFEIYLINSNNLLYQEELIKMIRKSHAIYLDLSDNEQDSKIKKKFQEKALHHYFKWLKNNDVNVNILSNQNELKELINKKSKNLYTFYPCVGYEKDKINKLSKELNFNINYLHDSLDLMCWPHAKSGFFKFKNNIDEFIDCITKDKELNFK